MVTAEPTGALRRRGLRLEYATLAWNAVEGTLAIVAGLAAHSIALTAYGLDSAVEVFASAVAAWQLRADLDGHAARAAVVERRALLAIAGCFLVVAAYVGTQSIRELITRAKPEHSYVGLVITAAACVAMTLLGVRKRDVGRSLGNRVLTAEAAFSLVDAALSATVLVGLALNALAGLWWADPGVALAVALFALREGWIGLRPPAEGPRSGTAS